MTENYANVNRKYKDTVFRLLFSESKENALSLYNALNGTQYTNTDDLTFTTIEDAIYMTMKNDCSFLVSRSLNLYEHQSTYNPNMPLRGLYYFARLYRDYLGGDTRLYKSALIRIPTPKYVVFYNGTESSHQEDMVKLRLSDMFMEPDESGEFEWTATMININHGHNKELMESCKVLNEYAILVDEVRENVKKMPFTDAIDTAIENCISNGILEKFLIKNRKDFMTYFLDEFDEEKFIESCKEDGRVEGKEEERQATIERMLKSSKLTIDDILEMGYSKEEIEKAKKFMYAK